MKLAFNLIMNLARTHDVIQNFLEMALEQADQAYDVAEEAALAELNFDIVLNVISALPEKDKAQILHEALQGQFTSLLTDICTRFISERTTKPLQHAAHCASMLNNWKSIKPLLTLSK